MMRGGGTTRNASTTLSRARATVSVKGTAKALEAIPEQGLGPNRAQQRDHVRALGRGMRQGRQARRNIFGFGKWRRHRYLNREQVFEEGGK